MLKDDIRRLADNIHKEIIDIRRHLHANPELSFNEYDTSAFIKDRLDKQGIPWTSMATTGIVATIEGRSPSQKTLMLRADMDALPITETSGRIYASRNPGIMHACGHDAHMASLLGTALILQSIRAAFTGTVKLVFQPGEEILPGGASLMIKEGMLKNPSSLITGQHSISPPIIGQHCMPALDTGKVACRKGPFMASMDELRLTVRGKGGHGAMPHRNIDPVLIAAHILVALQQVVSRMANPASPTVLSFGKVIANGAVNVIPDEVHMEGTFRAFDETWRNEAHTRMKSLAEGIAGSMGGACDLQITRGYPVLKNEEALTGQVMTFAEEYLGMDNVVQWDLWTAAEDFAYYSQVTDACFYLLGTGNAQKQTLSSLHASTFDIDEDALALSTGLMAYIAVRKLEAQKGQCPNNDI
ncbi:MAG TPA: M20 family metallopeptidase [Puia sp.]|nr:M20 family metallopeptidase [Puia sp.]